LLNIESSDSHNIFPNQASGLLFKKPLLDCRRKNSHQLLCVEAFAPTLCRIHHFSPDVDASGLGGPLTIKERFFGCSSFGFLGWSAADCRFFALCRRTFSLEPGEALEVIKLYQSAISPAHCALVKPVRRLSISGLDASASQSLGIIGKDCHPDCDARAD
jgi:hypothetical protein